MSLAPATPAREPFRSGEAGWEGAIFLPGSRRGSRGDGRLFFGRMKGESLAYPFVQNADAVFITPIYDAEVFRALLDSEFKGEEWVVRMDATHGKSKTYRRHEVFGHLSRESIYQTFSV